MWCRSYFAADRLTYTIQNADGQWVVQRSKIKFLYAVTIAEAVEARSIASRDGRMTLSRVGVIIPQGQRVLMPGESAPDYKDDFPYIGGERAGFALEHPEAPWISRGAEVTRVAARHENSWMTSFGYWAAPGWNVHAIEYEIHYWPLTFLLAIAPATRVIAEFRRRRRLAAGHCTSCGYDLRATPDRCPECGADAVSVAARGGVPASR
jgi:hypothetical protein